MHMGSLPITANIGLSNLVHVVLNNGIHESVGGQKSVGFSANLTGIARNSGYDTLATFVSIPADLKQGLDFLQGTKKSGFLEVRIKKGMRADMPILKADTVALKDQFVCSITK